MELALSVAYESCPPIGCFVGPVIGWSICSPENTSLRMRYGLRWPVGISTGFQFPLTVSLHSTNDRQIGCIRLCKETVKASLQWRHNEHDGISNQITSLMLIYSGVYSGADQGKHQRSASLFFVRRIHRWPVNSPHKVPVTRKMLPFDDVIMVYLCARSTTPLNLFTIIGCFFVK